VLGVPSVILENGIIHVSVKARITVDKNILDQQIKEIIKERGTLKKLEDAQEKVRELWNRLANLKSSEVKRLEEVNAQALALKRERERQRLPLEEQVSRLRGNSRKRNWSASKKKGKCRSGSAKPLRSRKGFGERNWKMSSAGKSWPGRQNYPTPPGRPWMTAFPSNRP